MNWLDIHMHELLTDLGAHCANREELAIAVSDELGTHITLKSLQAAHARHKRKQKLLPNLSDYLTAKKVKWWHALTDELLAGCGSVSRSIEELATVVGNNLERTITPRSLEAAHARHKKEVGLRSSLAEYLNKTNKAPKPPKLSDVSFSLSDDRIAAISKARRIVVTCALNNTEIDEDAWRSLQHYLKRNNAELVVLPIRYKNPTDRLTGAIFDEGAWWPDVLVKYMTDDLVQIHEHFYIMGHVRVQATAANPLSGLDTISKGASAVFGHPQLAMKPVPTPQNKLPKVLYTSCSISKASYSTTKAGVKALAAHTIGGLVIELDGPRFHVRQLICDESGGFYDIDRYYGPNGVSSKTKAVALVTGDEHVAFNDDKCRAATYGGKTSIVGVTKPEYIVRHDVFDGYSVNHHSDKDPVTQIAKHESGMASVRGELDQAIEFIDKTTPKGATNIIVSSNHHDHLLQWMKSKNVLDSPTNGRTWHELWGMVMETVRMTPNGARCDAPFDLWCKKYLKTPVEFVGPSDPFCILGIDISNHGHVGTNGARGSLTQFSKLGVKTITGHSHTPGICGGAWAVGTSSRLELEYTRGPSTRAHAHCLIHQNGKRQLIIVIDGEWRLKI